jgi:hypothetical protein
MLTPETDPEDLFLSEPNDTSRRQTKKGATKVQQVLGGEADASVLLEFLIAMIIDSACRYYIAKLAQSTLPWFVRPVHVGEEIRLEGDDSVRAGTIEALIERLTMDSLRQ